MYIDYNTKFKLTFYEILYFHLYTHLKMDYCTNTTFLFLQIY